MVTRKLARRFLVAFLPFAYYVGGYAIAAALAYAGGGVVGALLFLGVATGVLAWSHDRCHVELDRRRYGASPMDTRTAAKLAANALYGKQAQKFTPPYELPTDIGRGREL